MAEMEDLKSAQSQPGYDQCALTSATQRLLDTAKGLSFGAYPAHGSGFVCIVNGDLDAFRDAIAEADQLLSASPPPPAEPPVEGWRGIESAPRDGARILLRGPYRIVVAWWGDLNPRDFMSDRPHEARMCWLGEGNIKDGPVFLRLDYLDPTHWIPLPSPPLSAKDTSERNDLAGDDDKAKPSTSLGGDSRASVADSGGTASPKSDNQHILGKEDL